MPKTKFILSPALAVVLCVADEDGDEDDDDDDDDDDGDVGGSQVYSTFQQKKRSVA